LIRSEKEEESQGQKIEKSKTSGIDAIDMGRRWQRNVYARARSRNTTSDQSSQRCFFFFFVV
jgi:uncharacterized protein (UPF0262 family)